MNGFISVMNGFINEIHAWMNEMNVFISDIEPLMSQLNAWMDRMNPLMREMNTRINVNHGVIGDMNTFISMNHAWMNEMNARTSEMNAFINVNHPFMSEMNAFMGAGCRLHGSWLRRDSASICGRSRLVRHVDLAPKPNGHMRSIVTGVICVAASLVCSLGDVTEMDDDVSIDELREAVEHLHGVPARYVETVAVDERFKGVALPRVHPDAKKEPDRPQQRRHEDRQRCLQSLLFPPFRPPPRWRPLDKLWP
jgi:hypothetical protein